MPKYMGANNFLSKTQYADQVDPADVMEIFRADPTGKFGGKDRMETLPTRISRSDLYGIASILNSAEKVGMPKISSQELANRVLLEGRGDAGGSAFDRNKKKYRDIDAALGGFNAKEQTNFSTGPGFAATYADKVDVSNRLGIPLDKAWIGTGKVTPTYGGNEYAQRGEAHRYAAAHPKNASLVDYIERARSGKLTPQEIAMAEIQDKEARGLHTNKITDPVKLQQHVLAQLKNNPNAYKAVSELNPQALQHSLHNFYRKETGIPEKPWGSYYIENKDVNIFDLKNEADLQKAYRRASMDERGATSVVAGIPAVTSAFRSITGLPEPEAAPDPGNYGMPMATGGSVKMPDNYSVGSWKLI